jgi:hypothetical protein
MLNQVQHDSCDTFQNKIRLLSRRSFDPESGKRANAIRPYKISFPQINYSRTPAAAETAFMAIAENIWILFQNALNNHLERAGAFAMDYPQMINPLLPAGINVNRYQVLDLLRRKSVKVKRAVNWQFDRLVVKIVHKVILAESSEIANKKSPP